jgi:hypothetical protein
VLIHPQTSRYQYDVCDCAGQSAVERTEEAYFARNACRSGQRRRRAASNEASEAPIAPCGQRSN